MSRTTPILPLAIASLAAVLIGPHMVDATSEPVAPTPVDCSDAGEPVEYDDPSLLIGEGPVAWLTLDDGGPSMVTYDLDAVAGQFVVEVTSEFGGAADVVVTHEGAPFLELSGVPAGRQCIVDVEFAVGRFEWHVAGGDEASTFGVPHRVECGDSPVGDPWAAAGDGLMVVVDVGDDEVGVASGQALVAGAATIAVHAVEGTSDEARVTIERDGDAFATFDDVPPGGVCPLDVELPTGDYVVTTDLIGEPVTFTVWPVAVLDLTALTGGDDPVRLGLDDAQAASYTDACDVFGTDLIVAAVPAELGAATAAETVTAEPADSWQVACEWSVDVTAVDDVRVELTLPGAVAGFDAQRAEHAAEPGFVDLGVIADGCYAIASTTDDVATATCPYGPSQVTVTVSASGAVGTSLVGTVTTLLDNLWNRPAN